MNEEFYAVLKLVSGEELFSQVCGVEENGRVLVILHHPIKIRSIEIPGSSIAMTKIYPWNELSTEDIFMIPREHIIFIQETEDKSLIKLHQRYLREISKQSQKISSHSKITPDMGYISSVKDAISYLEKIYEISSSSTNEPQN
jgi:hypothetical protein